MEGIGIEDSNLDGVVDDNDITYLKSGNIVGYNIKACGTLIKNMVN